MCRCLKQSPLTAGIPIIFVTASARDEEENACWEAGGVDFVGKPVNPLTLRKRVNMHLQFKFQSDALRALQQGGDLAPDDDRC